MSDNENTEDNELKKREIIWCRAQLMAYLDMMCAIACRELPERQDVWVKTRDTCIQALREGWKRGADND